MKKLKVLKAFFDKVEDRYVYPDKEPEIEREEKRAEQFVQAGVCELVEEGQDSDDDAGQLPPATTSEDDGANADSEDESAGEETSSEESTEDETSEEGNETPEKPKKQTRGRRTSNK